MSASLTQPPLDALYQAMAASHAMSVADGLIDAVFAKGCVDAERFQQLFHWLATGTPDVEVAKLSLALLGAGQDPRNRALFLTFGKHEEFASFVAVALANCASDAEEDLFQLAKGLRGWGRISLVERLEGTERADIKDWVLREGFRNSIMTEYLACIAARMGDLAGQLRGPADPALLDAAAEIFIALSIGGPAEDMHDYADAEEAARLFVTHMTGPNVSQCRALAALEGYAKGSERWPHLADRIEAILASDHVRTTVEAALAGGDRDAFWAAKIVAAHLGWDIWQVVWDRHSKGGERWWYEVMRTEDPARVARVLDDLRASFDLEAVTGPPECGFAGFGEAGSVDEAMDAITQELRHFSGQGGDVLKVALRGRSIRLRNLACAALQGWARTDWPEGVEAALRAAAALEPDGELQVEMAELAAK